MLYISKLIIWIGFCSRCIKNGRTETLVIPPSPQTMHPENWYPDAESSIKFEEPRNTRPHWENIQEHDSYDWGGDAPIYGSKINGITSTTPLPIVRPTATVHAVTSKVRSHSQDFTLKSTTTEGLSRKKYASTETFLENINRNSSRTSTEYRIENVERKYEPGPKDAPSEMSETSTLTPQNTEPLHTKFPDSTELPERSQLSKGTIEKNISKIYKSEIGKKENLEKKPTSSESVETVVDSTNGQQIDSATSRDENITNTTDRAEQSYGITNTSGITNTTTEQKILLQNTSSNIETKDIAMNCSRRGHHVQHHPTDLHYFVECSNGVPKKQRCSPEGTVFSNESKTCVWPDEEIPLSIQFLKFLLQVTFDSSDTHKNQSKVEERNSTGDNANTPPFLFRSSYELLIIFGLPAGILLSWLTISLILYFTCRSKKHNSKRECSDELYTYNSYDNYMLTRL